MAVSNEDINTIFQAMRKGRFEKVPVDTPYTADLFGKCGALFHKNVNEAYLLTAKAKYLPKKSASLSDVIVTEAVDPQGQKFQVAVKSWLTWDKFTIFQKVAKLKIILDRFHHSEIEFLKFFNIEDLKKTPEEEVDKFFRDINNSVKQMSLEYEARMYKYITENIVMRNISPNFIPILGSGSCTVDSIKRSLESAPDFDRKAVLYDKIAFLNAEFPGMDLKYIITGSFKNFEELYDSLIRLHDAGDRDGFASLIFQGFYALYVMAKYEIRHGDLHFGNILVETLDIPVRLHFNINGNEVIFETPYILKIFDLDRSYNESVGDNPFTFVEIGNVNSYLPQRDFIQFICQLTEFPIAEAILVDDLKLIPERDFFGFNSFTIDAIMLSVTEYEFVKAYINRPERQKFTDLNGTEFTLIPFRELKNWIRPSKLKSMIEKISANKSMKSAIDQVWCARTGNRLNYVIGAGCQLPHKLRINNVELYFEDKNHFDTLAAVVNQTVNPFFVDKSGISVPVTDLSYTYKPPAKLIIPSPDLDTYELTKENGQVLFSFRTSAKAKSSAKRSSAPAKPKAKSSAKRSSAPAKPKAKSSAKGKSPAKRASAKGKKI